MKLQFACLALLLPFCLATTGRAADDLASKWYPATAVAPETPEFVLVTDEVAADESAKAWGEQAKQLCDQWFPLICHLLHTEDWTPPQRVELVLKKEQDAPGVTIGSNIYISAAWIKSHPEDFGMVIHELTHVVQSYPHSRGKPGWLVEGIADYVRYWKYEAERPRYPLNRNRAKYTDGYNNTAAFLAFLTWKYDRRIVPKLDAALRTRRYNDKMFETLTGKNLDDLWADFLANNPMA